MSQSLEDRKSDRGNEVESQQTAGDQSGLIKLHIESTSFVFTQDSKALQLTFDDCEFNRRGKNIERKSVATSREIKAIEWLSFTDSDRYQCLTSNSRARWQ